MKKTRNTCLTCLDYYGCMKMGLKPSIGVCSLKRPDQRQIALTTIRDAVTKAGGSVTLRRKIRAVADDFIGPGEPIEISRISLEPGTQAESLIFLAAPDTTTDRLETSILEKIASQL